ncbi:MAG: hypothetical protein NTX02_10140 [Planctomycetia bacterium]|nr:hypothetical protein [Planctomycetia bacterium]
MTFDPTAQTSSDIVSKQISSEDPSSIPRSDSLAKTLPSALQKPLMLSDVPNTATNINEHSSAALTQEPVVSPRSSRRILDWGIGVMVVVLVVVLISLKQLNAMYSGRQLSAKDRSFTSFDSVQKRFWSVWEPLAARLWPNSAILRPLKRL